MSPSFRIPTTTQLLGKLPATVRGVGLELMGKMGVGRLPGMRGRKQDATNLIGCIVVVRGYITGTRRAAAAVVIRLGCLLLIFVVVRDFVDIVVAPSPSSSIWLLPV